MHGHGPDPRELEDRTVFFERPLLLRPIRPEDEAARRVLFNKLHPDDIRFQFFGLLREPAHSDLARNTQINYERQMAFIATRADENNQPETLGVARNATEPDNITAKFAVVVRSNLKGKRRGSIFLKEPIDYCPDRGTGQVIGTCYRTGS